MRLPQARSGRVMTLTRARPSRPPSGESSPPSFHGWISRAVDCVEPPRHAAKASEWLLDNEFQVRRAIRQVREDLPTAFYRRLPRLAAPEFRGIPRVMALAQGMLDFAHMQVSLAGSRGVRQSLSAGRAADDCRALGVSGDAAPRLPGGARSFAFRAFARTYPAIRTDTPIDATRDARPDRRRLARDFGPHGGVEHLLEGFLREGEPCRRILQGDPAGVYPAMDFDTRDRYRKAVEEIADGAGCPSGTSRRPR